MFGCLASKDNVVGCGKGIMTFDTPDFNAQLESNAQALFNTVLHEMGHILGIGTLWRPQFLENPVFGFGPPNFNNQPTFTGAEAGVANAQLTQIGAPQVLVENSGGQGTAGMNCVHFYFE